MVALAVAYGKHEAERTRRVTRNQHGRDLEAIVDAVRKSGGRSLRPDWNATVDALAEHIEQAIESVLANRSLADLVDEDFARVDAGSGEAGAARHED
jgi:hypothetical protein